LYKQIVATSQALIGDDRLNCCLGSVKVLWYRPLVLYKCWLDCKQLYLKILFRWDPA